MTVVAIMKPGELVKLCDASYPQYKGKLGLLVREQVPGQWIVVINGRMHPYQVHYASMEIVSGTK